MDLFNPNLKNAVIVACVCVWEKNKSQSTKKTAKKKKKNHVSLQLHDEISYRIFVINYYVTYETLSSSGKRFPLLRPRPGDVVSSTRYQ